MAKSCRDGVAHKIQKPTHSKSPASILQHHLLDQQDHYIDDLEVPPVEIYGDYQPPWMASECTYDGYMYPTPPLTASVLSEDDDPPAGLSTYSEPLLTAEGIPTNPFPRISKPVELLRHSYDCVVIGSGYGGSIAASRMARAGESVCLLERGEERWPGEYPTASMETFKQWRFTGEITPSSLGGFAVNSGNPTGMFNLFFGRDQSVLLGNGA